MSTEKRRREGREGMEMQLHFRPSPLTSLQLIRPWPHTTPLARGNRQIAYPHRNHSRSSSHSSGHHPFSSTLTAHSHILDGCEVYCQLHLARCPPGVPHEGKPIRPRAQYEFTALTINVTAPSATPNNIPITSRWQLQTLPRSATQT